MSKFKFEKFIPRFIFISLLIPIIFLIIKLIIEKEYDSNLILMLTQCILGLVAFFLPAVLERRWKLEIPSTLYIAYLIFLYCSVFLGEVRNFYYVIPY